MAGTVGVAIVLLTVAPGSAGGRDAEGLGSDIVNMAPRQQTLPAQPGPTPQGPCGPGSNPETGIQGRVPPEDHASGRAAQGYHCNTRTVGRAGVRGGFRTERYVDAAGRECAYYDTNVLFPTSALFPGGAPTGTAVLDMGDPSKPVETARLMTPAMQSPHESVSINEKRGLLAAVYGNPAFGPGIFDVYDVSQDCRAPVLMSSAPVGIIGHEGNFAPDGLTYYAAGLDSGQLTAIDVSNPTLPVPLWTDRHGASHGLSVSDDGKRLYLARRGGLVILDTTQIQDRVPNPTVPVVSTLVWEPMSTPQMTIPVTIGGRAFLIEMDEFAADSDDPDDVEERVGAARIIDVADETKPRVISNIRLDVHTAAKRPGISGDQNFAGRGSFQPYAGHYCGVPQRVEPGIVACTMIQSGLRVFDIRDPQNPKEIAYHNEPQKTTFPDDEVPTTYAMSSVAFVPQRSEIWYSDGNTGFIVVGITNGVWPFTSGQAAPPAPVPAPAQELPATGGTGPAVAAVVALVAALALRRLCVAGVLRPPLRA